jgi:hypothetical protein
MKEGVVARWKTRRSGRKAVDVKKRKKGRPIEEGISCTETRHAGRHALGGGCLCITGG